MNPTRLSAWAHQVLTRSGIGFMWVLATLPLPLIRLLGAGLGLFLYAVAAPRRRVVMTNLALCFPEQSAAARRARARGVFVKFAQAWLDRSWLWHAAPEVVVHRLKVVGAEHLAGEQPSVIFAPHFVGMDAGWTALTGQVPRAFTTIYTNQANRWLDRWILRGRRRFAHRLGGGARLFGRVDGVKDIAQALKAGQPLYLLPDMNFGAQESIFVPFFGVPAATVPSLHRFARLARAQVTPVVTRMTPGGYEVRVLAPWTDFPSADAQADTARMNRELERYIAQQPEQYYWVHKRFKTRPDGQASVY